MDESKVQTLLELLAYRARVSSDQLAYTYENEPCTYRELWHRINQFASYLQSRNLEQGGRVLMVLPNGHEFFVAFYGAQRAGGIAVPVFPGYSSDRILHMARLCAANIVVLPSDTPSEKIAEFRRQTEPLGLDLLTVAQAAGMEISADLPDPGPDDIAFLQYTSGTTGDPKGVQLSQRNLITNVNQMIAGMEITRQDIFVSWLPVYHDMGLILKTMVPFYLGAQTHLLATGLNQVSHWLDAIGRHQATFTAAPDFAYRLVLSRIRNPQDYDLSSLRVALNAAEPVRANTISNFEAAFGLNRVMVAGYGLAEATVGVSMWKPGRAPKVDQRGVVSVGLPFPEVDIRILKDGVEVPSDTVGDIAISTAASTCGYFRNPSATATLYGPEYPLERPNAAHSGNSDSLSAFNDWWGQQQDVASRTILSGDIGYVDDDGYLYIVGRKKNTIVQTGETLYAAEIEEVVNEVDSVRYCAALGIELRRLEGEVVNIFAEVRFDDSQTVEDYQDTVIEIVAAFLSRFGFRPGSVYLLNPGSIPLTYNGKLQHQQLKASFLDDSLKKAGRILFPDY